MFTVLCTTVKCQWKQGEAKPSFQFIAEKVINSVCVVCQHEDLQPCFHLEQNLSMAPTSESILNWLSSLEHHKFAAFHLQCRRTRTAAIFMRKVSMDVLRDYDGNKQEWESIPIMKDSGDGGEEIIKYTACLSRPWLNPYKETTIDTM